MIGYGLAFVIGYLVTWAVRVFSSQKTYPWSLGPVVWGFVFVGLNWVATL